MPTMPGTVLETVDTWKKKIQYQTSSPYPDKHHKLRCLWEDGEKDKFNK